MFSIRKWDFPKLNLTYFLGLVSVDLKENFNLNLDLEVFSYLLTLVFF